MAKFVYRMQSILDLKVKLEEQEKNNFALANAALLEEQKKLEQLVIRRSKYESAARDLRQGTIHIKDLESNRKAIEAMKVLIRAQLLSVQKAQRNADAARRKLTEVMKERKMQEKLREKAFEQFKAELAYDENKAVDELVSYTYHNGEEEWQTN